MTKHKSQGAEIEKGDVYEVKNAGGKIVGKVLVATVGQDPYTLFGHFFQWQERITPDKAEFSGIFSALPIKDGDWEKQGHLDLSESGTWTVPTALARDSFRPTRVNVVKYNPQTLEEESRKSVPEDQISTQQCV